MLDGGHLSLKLEETFSHFLDRSKSIQSLKKMFYLIEDPLSWDS